MIVHSGWHYRLPPGGCGSQITDERNDMTNDAATRPAPEPMLLAQVREAFGRVAYSHKTHEKQADLHASHHRAQQWSLVALTTISSGTFLASLAGLVATPKISSLVTSFIALLVTGTSLATKTFTFAEDAEAHRDTAAQLWEVRESYISLITDLMSGAISASDARARRDELQVLTGDAYATAPRTTRRAFMKASSGLKDREELTFASDEIDPFLPEALRLGKPVVNP